MKKVAIIQSNYIPWKGYFDIINSVSEFVIYDCAQYTKNDWRNRNMIKTPQGKQWLTIPCKVDRLDQRICDIETINDSWRVKHWKSIKQNYSKSPYFDEFSRLFENLYMEQNNKNLSSINVSFISAICGVLNINTKIRSHDEFSISQGRNEKLISICRQMDADVYVTGPSATAYLDETLFSENGISIEVMSYSGYEEYQQPYPPFDHNISVIDLIFSQGPKAKDYLLSNYEEK